jgi:aryl-alcohol dehydrogenase-like predicted oxidoreductase
MLGGMKHRPLGKTGFNVSEIGFGAWAIGGSWGPQEDGESIRALHRALDLGVNFIDTAAGYGDGRSEWIIGQVLRDRKEENLLVATKTPPLPGSWPPSPWCRWEERYPESYLRENVEQRLRNLGTDALGVLQLHTWTRAWNHDPQPLLFLQKLKREGKIRAVGISTPEHDQNSVIALMEAGLLDTVQVIYNIFEQEPAAELLPVAHRQNVGIIVRVAFDEGALTGKFNADTTFADDDFRSRYFEGDRLARTVGRVEQIRADVDGSGFTLAEAALKFALLPEAVSTVIPGIRTVAQAEANAGVSTRPDLPAELMERLRGHRWNRAFWYSGK